MGVQHRSAAGAGVLFGRWVFFLQHNLCCVFRAMSWCVRLGLRSRILFYFALCGMCVCVRVCM